MVEQELVVRTFVVAMSVFVESSDTVAFRLTVDCETKPIALAVDRMKRAIELHEIAGLAGLP